MKAAKRIAVFTYIWGQSRLRRPVLRKNSSTRRRSSTWKSLLLLKTSLLLGLPRGDGPLRIAGDDGPWDFIRVGAIGPCRDSNAGPAVSVSMRPVGRYGLPRPRGDGVVVAVASHPRKLVKLRA